MAVNLKHHDFRAQLWSIPGPLFVCCILFSIVLKSTYTPLILPIIAVGGVVACQIWKWRGVAFSSAFLAAALIYILQSQSSQEWLWTIVLVLSIAASFVVTVLCSEEAYHAWDMLSKDSGDHKQTVSLLNERFQAAQNRLVAEQNELNAQIEKLQRWRTSELEEREANQKAADAQINLLKQQLAMKEEKQRSNEQLLKLAREQMTAAFERQENLMQELLQEKENNSREAQNPLLIALEAEKQELEKSLLGLQEELEIAYLREQEKQQQAEKEQSLYSELEQEKNHLEELFTAAKENENALVQDLEELKQEHGSILLKLENQKQLVVNMSVEKEGLQEQLKQVDELKQEYASVLKKLEHQKEAFEEVSAEKEGLQEQLQLLQEQLQENSESAADNRELRKMEGLYQQLRQQFTEKSEILAATRKELFATQEQLSALQKDWNEAEINGDKETVELLHGLLAEAESELAAAERQHTIEINSLHEVIDSLVCKAG